MTANSCFAPFFLQALFAGALSVNRRADAMRSYRAGKLSLKPGFPEIKEAQALLSTLA
jgi:hypothetical protein